MTKHLYIVAVFFATSTFAQLSVSTSCSFSMEKIELGVKDRIGQCLNFYYYFPEEQGLSLQFRNMELWKYSSGPNDFVQLKTVSIQGFLYEFTENGSKFFFTHQVGVLAALGHTVYEESSDLHLLKTSLFSGIFIEIGTGTRLSKKLILVFSLKSEGVYGLVRNGSDGGQVGGANGFGSINIRLVLNQMKNKSPT